jgi:hypothetical protein
MKNNKFLYYTASAVFIFLIIFFYFLRWRTRTIYGDDLYVYDDHLGLKTFSQIISYPPGGGKYRPVNRAITYIVIELFKKNLMLYYVFNVAIQALNTFLLALIINLFVRSRILSVLLSLVFGISRFPFHNISQLMFGGVLEGLAMTFFMAFLFYIVKFAKDADPASAPKNKANALIWSLVFANLDLYTHERYIVLLPFVVLMVLFFPAAGRLSAKQKISFSVIAILSMVLNVAIKKYLLNMPFFVGTGGDPNMSFSLNSALSFLSEGILAIFQINIGPQYLSCLPIVVLPPPIQLFDVFVFVCLLAVLFLYVFFAGKAFAQKEESTKNNLFIFISLVVLLLFCLAPAVSTIRLEHRWLQASFAVFILMLSIALSSFPYKNNIIKYASFLGLAGLILVMNNIYFSKGASNLFMKMAETDASHFKQALDNNTIHANTERLYIWEKQKRVNEDNGLNWALGNGHLFEFYQGKDKKIIFADSIYENQNGSFVTTFPAFNKSTDQIVYIKDYNLVMDVTDEYLKDSLKSFNKSIR